MTSSTVCCVLLFRIFKLLFLKNSSFSSDEVPLSLNGANFPLNSPLLTLCQSYHSLSSSLYFEGCEFKYSIGYFSQWCGVFLCMYCILHINTLFRKQRYTIMVSHSKVHCGTVWFFYDRHKPFLSNVIILFFSVGKLSTLMWWDCWWYST